MTQGWTTNGTGVASWTTNESFSGIHSITAANTGTWLSPMLDTTPLQWYRLSFKSLAPGGVNNPGSIGYAYWAAQFFDTNNNLLTEDQYSAIFQSSNWATNEFRIRAKSMAGPNATLLPVRMQIRFQSISPQVFIDDVLLETTTPQEVAQPALLPRLPRRPNPRRPRARHPPSGKRSSSTACRRRKTSCRHSGPIRRSTAST